MKSNHSSGLLLAGAIGSILAGCGGGGSGGGNMAPPVVTPQAQNGSLSMLVSDASSEDWATIGVKILSIALIPQGGGSNVTVYTAPSAVPVINLVDLDQLGELIGNAMVPAGTYTGAVLTISANPGDVLLNVAADPETGFAGSAGARIASSDIQIQHTQGSAPNKTVSDTVNFVSPLVVNANQNNQLDLEFDLGHPTFVLGHVPLGGGSTIWAVNFDGPVRHHPLKDVSRLVLRHMYGDVTALDSTDTIMTITKELPTLPLVSPETFVTTTQSVSINLDTTNGTFFYDVDAKTRTVIKNFSAETNLVGRQVRVAARYQQDGTLIATRIWAGNSFDDVWVGPEGHVLHVNPTTDMITVENDLGQGIPLQVTTNTQIFLRAPWNPTIDGTPISTNGVQFIADSDLVRGFKVHASVVDITAVPLVAQSIDIETAAYDGSISAPNAMNFTYTHRFRTATDDYTYVMNYISSTTPNGDDPGTGMGIDGYKWWNFAYPISTFDSGSTAVGDFVSATNGAINFGGAIGPVPTYGVSYSLWNDPANPNGWAAAASIVLPSTLPLGTVASPLMDNAFTMNVAGGTTAATIDVSSTSGSATLVYQVDRTNGIVTVSPVDITMPAGMTQLTNALTDGTPVKVYGVPKANVSDTMAAYVLVYFTGDGPAQ